MITKAKVKKRQLTIIKLKQKLQDTKQYIILVIANILVAVYTMYNDRTFCKPLFTIQCQLSTQYCNCSEVLICVYTQ